MRLEEQTLPQFLARLAEAWNNSEGVVTARLARFMIVRLASGDIDEADYMRAFKLTKQEWRKKVKEMNDLLDAYAVVEDARGA